MCIKIHVKRIIYLFVIFEINLFKINFKNAIGLKCIFLIHYLKEFGIRYSIFFLMMNYMDRQNNSSALNTTKSKL